jgi:hypothetical protein
VELGNATCKTNSSLSFMLEPTLSRACPPQSSEVIQGDHPQPWQPSEQGPSPPGSHRDQPWGASHTSCLGGAIRGEGCGLCPAHPGLQLPPSTQYHSDKGQASSTLGSRKVALEPGGGKFGGKAGTRKDGGGELVELGAEFKCCTQWADSPRPDHLSSEERA